MILSKVLLETLDGSLVWWFDSLSLVTLLTDSLVLLEFISLIEVDSDSFVLIEIDPLVDSDALAEL